MTDAISHTLQVPGMSCGHCTSAIETAVGSLPHVERVTADLESKAVSVTGGDRAEIEAAIENAGYSVSA